MHPRTNSAPLIVPPHPGKEVQSAVPTQQRFYELFERGKKAGLADHAAYGYAALCWWGEHYGIPAPRIVSGLRSTERQRQLWANRKSNRYPVARPGTSKHEKGLAFDLPRGPHLEIFGHWSPLVGMRWGGYFARRDEIHFEMA